MRKQEDTIQVGIVGAGDGGMSNAKSLVGIEGMNLGAICDTDQGRLAAAGDAFPAAARFDTLEQMLTSSPIDLVVVATPDHLHLDAARMAITSGKHVFVEKPMATIVEDLVLMKRLADEYPGKLHFSEKYSFATPVTAALKIRDSLGEFMIGTTSYTMWKCDRIMGGGKWRTESMYNPCAGGLSHNFMTALLFSGSPITRVRATGQVLTYHENLDHHGGFDTMEGTLEFGNGRRLSWLICLAVRGPNSPFRHRTVTHTLQFENGALVYGPDPVDDHLILNGEDVSTFFPEPPAEGWGDYNIGTLYHSMHTNVLDAMVGDLPVI